jgi:predicted O-methyltransferase YrrM
LDALLHLYESVAPSVIIEFGVNTGRNAIAALRNIAGLERYVGIDVTSDYQATLPVQRREVPQRPGELALHDSRFQLVVRPRGSFELTADDLPAADAIFIDADHSRSGVENDYALARAVIRPGGVIVFHDDNGLPAVEVTQTLNDFCAAGRGIVHVEGTWLAFERIEGGAA